MSIFLKKEVFFVKFPIFFPIIYGFILFGFPSFETQLIFITILLLAETHFGATWPFIINKVNSKSVNEVTQSRIIMHNNYWVFFLILVLLTSEWILRRNRGMI